MCSTSSMGFPGDSVVKNLPLQCNAEDPGSNLGSGRSPGEGNGNPFQYSCLEIPWTEEPGGLPSMRSQRVGHDWVTTQHHHLLICISSSWGWTHLTGMQYEALERAFPRVGRKKHHFSWCGCSVCCKVGPAKGEDYVTQNIDFSAIAARQGEIKIACQNTGAGGEGTCSGPGFKLQLRIVT